MDKKIRLGPGPGARYPLIWVRTASVPWVLSRACPETQTVLFSASTVVIGPFLVAYFIFSNFLGGSGGPGPTDLLFSLVFYSEAGVIAYMAVSRLLVL